MDNLYFLIRHTPFWAVPLMIIGLEFGYMYWLKEKKVAARIFLSAAVICFMFICYYYAAGGPERSVKAFIKFLNQ